MRSFVALVAMFFYQWKYNDIVAFDKGYQMSSTKNLVTLIFFIEHLLKDKKNDKYNKHTDSASLCIQFLRVRVRVEVRVRVRVGEV